MAAKKKVAVLYPETVRSLLGLLDKIEEWRTTDQDEIDVFSIQLSYGDEPAVDWLRIERDVDGDTLVIIHGDLEVR